MARSQNDSSSVEPGDETHPMCKSITNSIKKAILPKKRASEYPWIKGIFLIATLLFGELFSVPFFNYFFVIISIIVISWVSINNNEEIFEYIFRVVMLIFWTTAAFNYFFAFKFDGNPYSPDYTSVFVRILKATSLITMMLDGFSGVEFAEKHNNPKQNPLTLAKFGAGSCIVCAIILIVSVFPEAEEHMMHTLFFKIPLSPLHFSMIINMIAIFPIYVFLVNNIRISSTRRNDSHDDSREDYIYKICRDFLWYINIPAVLGSLTMISVASILNNMTMPGKEIEGMLSGGMCFLIFSAVLIGVHIEHENRQLISQQNGLSEPVENKHGQ